jgi:hypothetical protein
MRTKALASTKSQKEWRTVRGKWLAPCTVGNFIIAAPPPHKFVRRLCFGQANSQEDAAASTQGRHGHENREGDCEHVVSLAAFRGRPKTNIKILSQLQPKTCRIPSGVHGPTTVPRGSE